MGKYILNQETQKLELHFAKAEYMALSDAQKQEIKSHFLWSRTAGAWVSRSTRDHYWAQAVAKKLNLENGGKEGERLTYAEELERKAERAEARAERFETYSDNAANRGASLTSEYNSFRGDIAFFTQPVISGHSGSQAFANRRNRIYARFDKGMQEYRKSEYYQGRAATAQATADMKQLKNPVYLHNRIKECNTAIKKLQGNIVRYEEILFAREQGTESDGFYKNQTTEQIQEWMDSTLDKIEWELDKLAFLENCQDEIGGDKFSRENIKVGYIVSIKRSGRRCEIVSLGSVNVTYKILDGGAAGMVLTAPYAAIVEVIKEEEKTDKIENPYQVGDILCKHRPSDDSIYMAYQVIKVTATGVKVQRIALENDKPVPGKFTGEPVQKKIVKSKWSEWIGVYEGDWQLHKYTA